MYHRIKIRKICNRTSTSMRKSRIVKNPQSLLPIGPVVLIVSLMGISSSFYSLVYGHDFIPNESASFMSFANQLQIESLLVQTNLANSSLALAREHAARAIELLNSKDPINNVTWIEEIVEKNQRVANELVAAVSSLENITMSSSSWSSSPKQEQSIFEETNRLVNEIGAIIDEAITTNIDKEQRVNDTIQATSLADIIDTLLRYYGSAYTVRFDMGNMSEMASEMNGNSSDMNYILVDFADYQSAQALAIKAQEIFNDELKLLANKNATNSIAKLEDGLIRLSNSIENKSSPIDVMIIGHSQIHPYLQAAFNLQFLSKM
jgi:hypothetical protein